MRAIGKTCASYPRTAVQTSSSAASSLVPIRMTSIRAHARQISGRVKSYCDWLECQMQEWQREREKFAGMDVSRLLNAPKVSGSSFAAPWAVQMVEQAELDALQAETERYAHMVSALKKSPMHRSPVALPGNPDIFGIGPMNAARNANVLDSSPSALGAHVISVSPGEWDYSSVIRGPYDFRACKYLFVIDYYGLHLLHELTPCKTTARGFGGHTQLASIDGQAAIGGEAFFSEDDVSTVVVNFGSGRFPPSGVAAMDAAAKYWLACGMNQVVAVFSARDLSVRPYGIGDRYGAQLQNKVYLRRLSIDMAIDMPIARTKTAHASRTIMLSRDPRPDDGLSRPRR